MINSRDSSIRHFADRHERSAIDRNNAGSVRPRAVARAVPDQAAAIGRLAMMLAMVAATNAVIWTVVGNVALHTIG